MTSFGFLWPDFKYELQSYIKTVTCGMRLCILHYGHYRYLWILCLDAIKSWQAINRNWRNLWLLTNLIQCKCLVEAFMGLKLLIAKCWLYLVLWMLVCCWKTGEQAFAQVLIKGYKLSAIAAMHLYIKEPGEKYTATWVHQCPLEQNKADLFILGRRLYWF